MILLNSYELIILNAEIYMVQNIEEQQRIAILLNIVKVLIILLIYLAVLCFAKKSYCLALHVKLGFFLRQSTF